MINQELAPPIIKNILPAFFKKQGEGINISIPFSMNRGVSPKNISGFALGVKNVQSSDFLFILKKEYPKDKDGNYQIDEPLNQVNFFLSQTDEEKYNKIKIGQYYKIQLAYLDKNKKRGLFSNIGTIKCTSYPNVFIKDLSKSIINQHIYSYTGVYQQEIDVSERVYSYCFNLYNSNEELIKTSGELLHNFSGDIVSGKSNDVYILSQDLDLNKYYYLEYIITTINGLRVASSRYKITQKMSIDPEIKAFIIPELNMENGYVDIYLTPSETSSDLKDLLATGDFILSRSCEDTNYQVWNNVSKFELYSQYPSKKIWRDFTVEQGKKYKYAIQQYNSANLYSNKIKSKEIYVDFDHAFLTDKNRQLKIKFNPKITSLKTNIPEAKVDTIGSKYPFIFRNSQVKYFEFPISGLISYFMDEENLFLSKEEFNIDFNALKDLKRSKNSEDLFEQFEKNNNIATTNPTAQNIQNERVFKLKVLEWLTDGNPKLFRSPTEGNYLVRLINCSLSPMDQIGRMLHNFNCTAYEIADFNFENLEKYGFISMPETKEPVLQFETISFYNQENKEYAQGILNKHPAYYATIVDATPGSQFILTFEEGGQEKKQIITIGVTGAYSLKIKTKVISIEIPDGEKYSQGSLTYGYYYEKPSTFETIHDATTEDIIAHQFIGEHDIVKEIEYIDVGNGLEKNPKVNILQLYSFSAYPRPVENVSTKPTGKPKNIYPIRYFNNEYYDYFNNEWKKYSKEDFEKVKPAIYYNGAEISNLPQHQELGTLNSSIAELTMNFKTMAEFSYQKQEIEYIVETDKEKTTLIEAKATYLNHKKALDDFMNSFPPDGTTLEEWQNQELGLRNNVNNSYKIYIGELISALKKEELKNV